MQQIRRDGVLAWYAVMAHLVLATMAAGQSTSPAWEPVTADRLLSPEDGDWMSYRRSYDVTGFSPLEQIDRTNVGDLRLV